MTTIPSLQDILQNETHKHILWQQYREADTTIAKTYCPQRRTIQVLKFGKSTEKKGQLTYNCNI